MSEGRGQVFVITAPSGVGKSTLIRHLLDAVDGLVFSVSTTTRARRPGEREGTHYRFVGRPEFERMAGEGLFLEWAEVHGNLYGTSSASVEAELCRGRDVLLDIDVQGARQLRARGVEGSYVFVLPPSYEALAERLRRRRTESEEALARRLANACDEVRDYVRADFVVINDVLETAARDLVSIVTASRASGQRRAAEAERIVASFPDSRQDDAGG